MSFTTGVQRLLAAVGPDAPGSAAWKGGEYVSYRAAHLPGGGLSGQLGTHRPVWELRHNSSAMTREQAAWWQQLADDHKAFGSICVAAGELLALLNPAAAEACVNALRARAARHEADAFQHARAARDFRSAVPGRFRGWAAPVAAADGAFTDELATVAVRRLSADQPLSYGVLPAGAWLVEDRRRGPRGVPKLVYDEWPPYFPTRRAADDQVRRFLARCNSAGRRS